MWIDFVDISVGTDDEFKFCNFVQNFFCKKRRGITNLVDLGNLNKELPLVDFHVFRNLQKNNILIYSEHDRLK